VCACVLDWAETGKDIENVSLSEPAAASYVRTTAKSMSDASILLTRRRPIIAVLNGYERSTTASLSVNSAEIEVSADCQRISRDLG
jgi:hypothetical protein